MKSTAKDILSLNDLTAGYDEFLILKNVTLSVPEGSISILMGPNGAGKSTLLKAVFHLATLVSGTITFAGRDITNASTHELLERGIAYVPQGKANFGTLTVRENLLIGAHHLEDRALVEKNISAVFNQFPILRDKQHEYAFSLSGGQQQMLALGRALMYMPDMLLLDEPSLGLSPKLVREMFANIRSINETFGTTVLIVEHNIKSALEIAGYGHILVNGELVKSDTADRLKGSEVLRKVFVGEYE